MYKMTKNLIIISSFIFQVIFSLNFSEIARKQDQEKSRVVHIELHTKDQSRMNQGWSHHDFYETKPESMQKYYVEPTLTRKIKTKSYNCYEERYVKKTKCLNNYYMSILNCTFPWLNSTKQSLEKCGTKHFIKDLVNLINDVSSGK